MIRGGGAGTVPWDLDDSMHFNGQGEFKRWGYWNTFGGYTINGYYYPPSDTSIRPFCYPLSTLSRLFPQGAHTVYASASGLDGMRTAAAKISNGGNYDLSFAIVNQQSTTKTVDLRVPAAQNQVTLREYLQYFRGDTTPAHRYHRVGDIPC